MTDWNLIATELSQQPGLRLNDKDSDKREAQLTGKYFGVNGDSKVVGNINTQNTHWRPALMRNRLGVAEPVVNASQETKKAVGPDIDLTQQVGKPEVIGEVQPKNAESGQALVDFEVFDGSGQAKAVDNSSGPAKSFDQPAESFIADERSKQPTATLQTTTDPNINRDRVTAALNDTKIDHNGKLSLTSDIDTREVDSSGGATSVEGNIENDQIPNKPDAVEMTNGVDRSEAPEITVTSVEDPVNANTIEEISQSEPPVVIDPTVVPIRVENTREPNSVENPALSAQPQAEIAKSTVQPAGETMVPETGSEGQRRIEAAKKEIFGGGKKFDQMVEEEREVNREKVIAPVPAQPGVQEPQDQHPEVHIDGQPEVIGRIEPNANAGAKARNQTLIQRVFGVGNNPSAKANELRSIEEERFKKVA